ncbi:hypothetical protein NPIL_107031 [Nephila pilipes]|uniref:Uncharacterized protein n=1 Tax=Nephila pilipes TaxID=299642 RepID=A0A8X6N0K9_NEPPI|nr:hypothetical protein NPIL_107031 [Nephila pilipes]
MQHLPGKKDGVHPRTRLVAEGHMVKHLQSRNSHPDVLYCKSVSKVQLSFQQLCTAAFVFLNHLSAPGNIAEPGIKHRINISWISKLPQNSLSNTVVPPTISNIFILK